MKYFTSELLVRYRSDDDAISESASDEWDQNTEAYRCLMDNIGAALPAAAKRLTSIQRHDGQLLDLFFGHDFDIRTGRLVAIEMKTEGYEEKPPVTLSIGFGNIYKFTVTSHPEVAEPGRLIVLYDEFGLSEYPGFFTYNLLVSDGTEVEIHFKDMNVSQA